MSALLPVPVPEVGPCGLWERQRKCSVRFSSNQAASLSLSLSISSRLFMADFAWLSCSRFHSTWCYVIVNIYLSIKSPDSVLIKGPQMIVCVCLCGWELLIFPCLYLDDMAISSRGIFGEVYAGMWTPKRG